MYMYIFATHIATKEEDENNENGIVEPKALSFLMKDYNYSYPLCACQSMAIYYNHNQAFIGFCAFFFWNVGQGLKLFSHHLEIWKKK